MSLKYIVVPGHVISMHDGQTHFIGFEELCDLYGVKSRDAIRFDPILHHRDDFIEKWPKAHWLFPDSTGKYQI